MTNGEMRSKHLDKALGRASVAKRLIDQIEATLQKHFRAGYRALVGRSLVAYLRAY
jgi:hypothetical protein